MVHPILLLMRVALHKYASSIGSETMYVPITN